MVSEAPARRLLLAGSWGPERSPVRLVRDDPDWHLPLHVRDETAARDRIASQVAAGADVVAAPTWLTHRRALLPVGETRRAGAWTAAAVRLARDAVELGLERRLAAREAAGDDEGPSDRPAPLVAAPLPALSAIPQTGTGHLRRREDATLHDYRDQAGHLADAEPDLLLVEGHADAAGTRLAAVEAQATGIPAWLALHPGATAGMPVAAWLEWSGAAGLDRIVLPRLDEASLGAVSGQPWGGIVCADTEVAAWLDLGASVVACLDGASAAAVAPLRTAVDQWERRWLEAAHAAAGRWNALVARAAAMAPGGLAVWVGSRPAVLPTGFEWLVVPAEEAHHLPGAHYRLAVVSQPVAAPGRWLERGGVLVTRGFRPTDEAGLRLIVVEDIEGSLQVILRQEG